MYHNYLTSTKITSYSKNYCSQLSHEKQQIYCGEGSKTFFRNEWLYCLLVLSLAKLPICLSHPYFVKRYWETPNPHYVTKEIKDVRHITQSTFSFFNFPFCSIILVFPAKFVLHFITHIILLIIWKQSDLLSVKAQFSSFATKVETAWKKL